MISKYIEITVREPMQLLDFIMKELSGISRNRAKDILKGHGIRVNQSITTNYDYELQPGQVVQISKHRRKTELDSQWIKIIYEDKDIIIIDKAPGILSAASSPRQFCVKTILDQYFERRHLKCHAHVVHRLDKETSGLMVYAKSIEAAQTLEENWKYRVFDRRYVAVVEGIMETLGGTCESYLKDDKRGVTHVVTENEDGGKLAITHWRLVQSFDECSLIELRLETGRKNQIRVHMAELGHPVCGDAKYGKKVNGKLVGSRLNRLYLHAYRLYLYHPRTGMRMEFETPYPTEFKRNNAPQTDNQDTENQSNKQS